MGAGAVPETVTRVQAALADPVRVEVAPVTAEIVAPFEPVNTICAAT